MSYSDKIYYADDLWDSGALVQIVFAIDYPNGLTLDQMLESDRPFLHRAAQRIIEREAANGTT